jgi:hypothetical protein
MRRATQSVVVLVLVLAILAFAGVAFAGKPSAGPTLTLTADTGATGATGSMSVPVGSMIHIAGANLTPGVQAVLYKGQWEPSSQFKGWAYVYYAAYWPDAAGTVTLNEGQESAGTYRYQVCQSVTSKGKTTSVCSAFIELTVS